MTGGFFTASATWEAEWGGYYENILWNKDHDPGEKVTSAFFSLNHQFMSS